jgi:hypothetical protein
MSIEPQSIQVGQCYLMQSGVVRKVTALPPGRVQFEQRAGAVYRASGWKRGILDLRSFAFSVERPVPCDWTPENDEA